jgi:hypothetical protein
MMKTNTSGLNTLIAARGGFIKETVTPGFRVDAAQKALLNRKGNLLFNEGNIESARRIFMTTGYSDGLSRIGDYYRSHGRVIDALQMYRVAPNKKKAGELTMNLAMLIKSMLADGNLPSKRMTYGT